MGDSDGIASTLDLCGRRRYLFLPRQRAAGTAFPLNRGHLDAFCAMQSSTGRALDIGGTCAILDEYHEYGPIAQPVRAHA